MFYGEYEHAIDRKGRVIIPAKFRQVFHDQNIETIFVTRGLDNCLFVFSESEWRLAESRFKQIPFTKAEGRKFNRLFFSGAIEVQLDRLGRILLPRHLKEFAQIKQDVVVVGVSSRIEIWAKEKWQEFYESSRQGYEDVAERV
ncbi:MAG: division/cell wall cluster transcriptional repressor MraZ, partial [Candidatus Omnitrophica bacterium]|nr:division/cell wall cluster transcriptional repressor MraZ [Candidatus Omnitrophota bacterium]